MKEWKKDFYENYSSNCNQKVDDSFYKKYIPYAKYIQKRANIYDKDLKILDLGCGLAGFSKFFHDQGFQNVFGVDTSSENIQIAKNHGINYIILNDVFTFFKENSTKYDFILALDLIEHFTTDEVILFLKECNKLLNKNGKLVIHTPNAEGIFGSKIRYSDITHEAAFTNNSLSQLGTFTGFTQINVFEDKPQIFSVFSFFRRVIWEALTIPFRLLFASESGHFNIILSQNLLAILNK